MLHFFESGSEKSNKSTMKVKRIRTTAPEIFKTTKNIKPIYVKYVFSPKTHASVRPNDILVKSH